MSELRILSTLAVMGAMPAIAKAYEAASGVTPVSEFSPTVAILDRLRAGAVADIAILTASGVDEMIREGTIQAGTRTDVALSFVGIAVKAGAPKPDISSVEAFKATLLAARSIAYSKIGASGIYFAGLIERLGIAEAVNAKAMVIATGFTAERAASGEVEIAVQQISELKVVPGIEVVGPLPEAIQSVGVFSAGLMAASGQPEVAGAFLRYLGSRAVVPALRAAGLEPAAGS
jgi:molybdate transport system substrate-binding protein